MVGFVVMVVALVTGWKKVDLAAFCTHLAPAGGVVLPKFKFTPAFFGANHPMAMSKLLHIWIPQIKMS